MATATHKTEIVLAGGDDAARRVALWLVWASDVTDRAAGEVLVDARLSMIDVEPRIASRWKDVEARVQGIHDDLAHIDKEIQAVSPRWKLGRMASIDRNILRVGAWELLNKHRSPLKVINACIDLGKIYGEKNTPAFINGLLDQLCKNHDIEVT